MSASDNISPGVPRIGPAFTPPGPTARFSSQAKPPPLPVSGTSAPASGETVATAETRASDVDGTFTVGWLVIVAGPGRGRSLALGPGMNHLGRASTNRLVLDFGDSGISARTYTTVTYDPRGRKFYVQPGPETVDLTYLGEGDAARPVLAPTEITGGETILLGKTQLKFVPFCGAGFSWD